MAEDDRGNYDLRRMQGTIAGEMYAELVERLEDPEERVEIAEWKTLIGQLMTRPEVVTGFMTVVDRCKAAGVNPGDFQTFKSQFISFVASEFKILFLDKLRDTVAYLAFLVSGRKPKMVSRVDSLEVLGLK